MATTVKKTKATSSKLYNPKYIFITPLVEDTSEGAIDPYKKGDTVYQCEEIIRDSTSITQEENTENPVENELSSSPIINNIQAGAYTVATEIADLQPELLKDLMGFSVDSATKKVYAPDGYVTKFAEFALVFPNGTDDGGAEKWVAAVLPKVQLSPTITIDSLSTSLGRIALGGNAVSMNVGTAVAPKMTPFYIDPSFAIPVSGGA